MLDRYLIEYEAPTLASLKFGSMFWYDFDNVTEYWQQLRQYNLEIGKKGLVLKTLRLHNNRGLLYIYRPSRLSEVLSRPEIRAFLRKYGYRNFSCIEAVDMLRRRVEQSADFPHEVGIFLGYPLEDVKEFIRNRGQNSICCGCWKVYHNPEAARRCFAAYKKCTSVYRQCYRRGRSISQLTVAV